MKYYGDSTNNLDLTAKSDIEEIVKDEVEIQVTEPTGSIKIELDKKINDPATKSNGQILEYDSSLGWKAADKPTGGVWGQITGTLSNQTDLQTALDGKQATLPTVSNDKYLHTNASTGALEWSTITVPTVVTGTLTAGQTSLVLSNAVFTSSSIIDIYTDVYGISPKTAVLATGTLTLTFKEQASDLGVRVEVR